MLGLALDTFPKPRRNWQGLAAIGPITDPDAGDMGLARGFDVGLLVVPAVVLDGAMTSLGESGGLVDPLAIDRQAVGGFDGEEGHGELRKTPKPGARPGCRGRKG